MQRRRPGFNPGVGKTPFRRAWQPTPGFLPGESPWTEVPGGRQPMASQRVGLSDEAHSLMKPQGLSGIVSAAEGRMGKETGHPSVTEHAVCVRGLAQTLT